MNKIGQPPLACDMVPLSGAWRKHWRRPSAGRGPGAPRPCSWPRPRPLPNPSQQDAPNHRRTETGLAGNCVVAPVGIGVTFTEARCSGLVFSHARIGIWAGLGCCGPVSASMEICLLPRRQVTAAPTPPRIQGPARDAPAFRLKCPHTPIVPRAECMWEIKKIFFLPPNLFFTAPGRHLLAAAIFLWHSCRKPSNFRWCGGHLSSS